jgi:hypothetical protein
MESDMLNVNSLVESLLQEGVFDAHTAEQWLTHIKSGVHAPVVNGYVSTLGGNDRPSIMLAISLDPKEEWPYHIFENSRYMKMSLHFDGTLEQISGHKIKFRKSRVTSADDVAAKINKCLSQAGGAK